MEKRGPHWANFIKIYVFFRKSAEKIQVSFKTYQQ
jgi:hypothetical protein